MAIRQRDALLRGLGDLRFEPIGKRIRGYLGDDALVDTRSAVLVWEPRRVVPSYGVPVAELRADLTPAAAVPDESAGTGPANLGDNPILDPGVPFAVHTADGDAVTIHVGGREVAGFRPADSALADLVVLDFAGVDAWFEEDERNVAHPRDPFHRIDVLDSSLQIRVELDGELLAESTRPRLLFETMLPTRYYLRPDDVVARLRPTPTRTWCAYKGQASYWSVSAGGHEVDDLAWSYPEPLHEAAQVRDLVCFFDERIDLVVDGQRRPRPVTPWS